MSSAPSQPKFIVVFNDDVTPEQIKKYVQEINENGGNVTQEYSLLKGFAASLPESFAHNLRSDKLIKYIEPDGVVTTQ